MNVLQDYHFIYKILSINSLATGYQNFEEKIFLIYLILDVISCKHSNLRSNGMQSYVHKHTLVSSYKQKNSYNVILPHLVYLENRRLIHSIFKKL